MTQAGSGEDAQSWLAQALARRHERAAQGLTVGASARGQVTVPVAMRAFDPAALLPGAMAFAAGLSTVDADAWFRCYTRTMFLFGDPANLSERHPPAVVCAHGQVAWLGVYDAQRAEHVRRLLRPVSGLLPDDLSQLDTVTGPDRCPGWQLHVAVRGLDLARYLVHLHHTVAEAVLTGVLPADATIALRHVEDLDPVRTSRTGCAYARVHQTAPEQPAPRLFTVLTRVDGEQAR
ncbi:MAG TPA: DUF6182 family protein [Micromonosporaceae bacterium]|nr:DUF6182 family protein [Micromonosporaceae bacterium]